MSKIYANITGCTIKINFRSSKRNPFFPESLKQKIKKDIPKSLRGFITTKKIKRPDFYVDIGDTPYTQLEPINDKLETVYALQYKIKNNRKIATDYHISLFQFSLIIRSLLTKQINLFLVHSSAVVYKNCANVFVGKSGAGKSTLFRILTKDNSCKPLADDVSAIRKEDNIYSAYNIPFDKASLSNGDNSINGKYRSYRLGKVFFLRKAKFCKAVKIKDKESILREVIEGIITFDRAGLVNQAKCALQFISEFDEFYILYFSKNRRNLLELLENLT